MRKDQMKGNHQNHQEEFLPHHQRPGENSREMAPKVEKGRQSE